MRELARIYEFRQLAKRCCASPQQPLCQSSKLSGHFHQSIFFNVAAMSSQQLQFRVTEVTREKMSLNARSLLIGYA